MKAKFDAMRAGLWLVLLLGFARAQALPPLENKPPTARFLKPTAGTSYSPGATVPIRIAAVDADGYVPHADLFVDGKKVEERTLNFFAKPAPGETQIFEFAWIANPAGVHRISVVVTDDRGGKSDTGLEINVKPKVENVRPKITFIEPKADLRYPVGATVAIVVDVVDSDGYVPHIEYYVDGKKIGEETLQFLIAPKPGLVQQFKWPWHQATAGAHRIVVLVADDRGGKTEAVREVQVGAEPIGTVWVKAGSDWKYNAKNTDLGEKWVGADFLDLDWPSGAAQLGFGDGDEATKIPAAEPRQPTIYFRRNFEVPTLEGVRELLVRLIRDDGAVVWLNGQRLLSDNMPDGAVKFSTLAADGAGDDENGWREFRVSPSLLVKGRNQLAVEVHQVSLTSSDISFDLELIGLSQPSLDGLPVVSIEATNPNTGEPCPVCRIAAGTFTLRRTGDPKAGLGVWLKYAGTATPGVDYGELASRVEFPAGQSTVEVRVGAHDDVLVEGDETVVAILVEPPTDSIQTYKIDARHARAEIVIHDDDSSVDVVPVVVIRATQPVTSEGCPVCLVVPGKFTLTRTGSTANALRVMMAYTGTAQAGVDYEQLPAFVEFAAGKASLELLVLGRYDELLEGEETVIATLQPDPTDGAVPHYRIAPDHASAKVVIQDGPGSGLSPVVSVEVLRGEVPECPPNALCKFPPAEFLFRRTSQRLAEPLTIQIELGGSARWMEDYVTGNAAGRPHSVTFEAGSETAKLSIAAVSDCVIEGAEIVVVEIMPDPSLGPIERYRVSPLQRAARVTIQDGSGPENDKIPVLSIRGGGQVPELCPANKDCPGIALVLMRKGGDLTRPLTVNLGYGGTATMGLDYSNLAKSVVFPAGKDSVSVSGNPIDDRLVEGNETLLVTLGCPADATQDYRVDGAQPSATITLVDNDFNNAAAVVQIVEPKEGSVFTHPDSILFKAQTLDPRGTMTHLDWYAGENKIGESDIVFIREPDPGMPLMHEFTWKKPTAGEHKVYAVGRNAAGQLVTSPAVRVRVSRPDARPVVTLAAGVAETFEVPPGSKRALIPATFILRRSGDATHPLKVLYSIGGSAKNGRDYSMLDGDATIAAGEMDRIIYVSPITDELVEGDESVEFTLLPHEAYTVGTPKAARVVIHDAQSTGEAQIAWVTPKNGEQFTLGSEIKLAVSTVDPAGYFVGVEFFANGKTIGEVPLVICMGLNCEPKLGAPLEFSFVWKNAPAGRHVLTAVGKSTRAVPVNSKPIEVAVTPANGRFIVNRTLPASYRAGVEFGVTLLAKPVAGTASYAAEDHPPKGWVVSGISDDGVWDASHGAVKFGPYFDNKERALTYRSKPADGIGKGIFTGIASANGVPSPIGGDQSVSAERQLHPADRDPGNWTLELNEVTAYGAAWKSGAGWPVGPNPIPLNYVTRAGALWRGGEGYVFDPLAGPAPLWWMNPNVAEIKPASLDFDLSAEDFVSSLQLLRNRQNFGLAEMIENAAGSTLRVRTFPGRYVRAQAVEGILPRGTIAREISEGGRFDAERGVVRWGPFFDAQTRTLTARIDGEAAATECAARASFDGELLNLRARVAPGGLPLPRIAEVRPLADGTLQFLVVDAGAVGCTLEFTEDLRTWHRIGEIVSGTDCQIHQDTDANESGQRYYRAVQR